MIFNSFFLTNKTLLIMENFNVKDALSVVELEGRFETTVAAVDTARCSDNKAEVPAGSEPSAT